MAAEEHEMTNEEIVKGIQTQINVAMALRMMALCFERFYGNADFSPYARRRADHLNKTAKLFIAHALKLIAANKSAVEQWMEMRKATGGLNEESHTKMSTP